MQNTNNIKTSVFIFYLFKLDVLIKYSYRNSSILLYNIINICYYN